MQRYRLYVDESGDHTFVGLDDPSKRYLALAGVIIRNDYYRAEFHPELDKLKQDHFPHSPDDPVILVRSRIIDRKGAFGRLTDPAKNAAWERDLIRFLGAARIIIVTVVIDKKAHLDRYPESAWHPYHYCMTVLLERYRGFLKSYGAQGDVLAESRGGTEDKMLKQVYRDVRERGTWYRSSQEFQEVITSNELKLKKKEHNIAGLQLADLIATPSKIDILAQYNRILARPPSRFTLKVIDTLRPKYNPYGRVFLG